MKLRLLSFAACIASICSAAPNQYSAEPISGRVIDAETRKPLSDVTVVAQWILEGGIHYDRVGILNIAEAVTDQEGRYRLAGWGPIQRPEIGQLDTRDPQIVFFKPGYQPTMLSNYGKFGPARYEAEVRTSYWNEKDVSLEKSLDTPKDYAWQVSVGLSNLSEAYSGKGCWAKKIPRAVKVFDKEIKRELAAGVLLPGHFTVQDLVRNPECKPMDAFLTELQKAE